ncbi:hypothetical protein IHQ72_30360 [Mesorhizobium onobrychidis]|uniref:CENP-V/GFA domain-containing protein n=2 Tax=Mesorhizobium onobrychidis TaxID=2775404 RepID=A0ABY5R892_9HYPH|nr:hypothetical protein IHQ72_30360 [Mesorhizobium onobrychidis]
MIVNGFQGKSWTATCVCGRVLLEAGGKPIVSAACYCASCQSAGRQLEALPGAPPLLEADGGTSVVLFRRDRVRCVRGHDLLAEHRLEPSSKTRRVVATWCNSAMFLDFTKGHWLTLYKERIPADDRPPLEMRAHSGRFMWRLLSSWAAMGFRTPEIDYVSGKIDG